MSTDYSLLFTCHPDPMWVYDLESLAFLDVNDAAVRAYGYCRDEFLGMTIKDIRPKEDLARLEQNISALDGGIDHAGLWTHVHKSGVRRIVDITSELIEFNGRKAELVCARDVTEQRAVTERLAQARKLEAIGILTGGIAHDFNNILTVILGNSELICELTDPDDDVHKLAFMVNEAAERGAGLTQKLLSYARRQTLEPKQTDLNTLIRKIEQALGQPLDSSIKLKVSLGANIWSCHVDPQRLETVIQNLVTNAIEAITKSGSIEISTENILFSERTLTRYASIPPGEYVRLSVRDDGLGMSDEVIEHIFEPFFTTQAPGKRSGLGLSVVHGFAKQSAAHIDIESSPGQGTTVSLYFQKSQSDLSKQIKSASEAQEHGNPGQATDPGRECILVVEDELLVRRHVTGLLLADGYQVVEAANPGEALKLIPKHPEIALLLTDIFLGADMDGRQLAECFKSKNAGLRVLFCSGYSGAVLTRDGQLKDDIVFLPKPYTREALLTAVRTALSR